MRRETVPNVVAEFRDAGGEVDYSFFADVPDSASVLEAAFESHFAELQDIGPVWRPTLNLRALPELPRRTISKEQFFGDWCDPQTNELKVLGSGTVEGGARLDDPLLSEFAGRKVQNWAAPVPDLEKGGQYAYAFSQPPYGVRLPGAEKQRLFNAINELIFPEAQRHNIVDWSSPELQRLSNYFEAGLEWWGVFLFTVHVPELERQTVISASTTD